MSDYAPYYTRIATRASAFGDASQRKGPPCPSQPPLPLPYYDIIIPDSYSVVEIPTLNLWWNHGEVFLFKRLSDGTIISDDFLKLRYPCYWHYDILSGLKVMVEAGFIRDSRCRKALELLASKRLPGRGFPAEKKHYTATENVGNGRSLVDWGGTSTKRMNPFVTADALYVLKRAPKMF